MTDRFLRDRLAALAGLQTWYRDAFGVRREVADPVVVALLAAMGLPADDDDAAAQSIDRLERERQSSLLPPVVVALEDEAPATVPLRLPADAEGRLSWRLETEDGEVIEGAAELGSLPLLATMDGTDRRQLVIRETLPLGYHRLRVSLTPGWIPAASTRLVVAPRRCHRPPSLEAEGRRWGLAVQLYAVRSARNWGIGDFTDLLALVRGAARRGAAAVGLSPLHALFPWNPSAASPYAPSSRSFLNILYLDIEAIEDFRDSAAARRVVAAAGFQDRLRALRAASMVDYPAVAALKLEVLELLSRAFTEHCLQQPEGPRAKAFQAFCETGGQALQRFAVFETLAELATAEGRGFGWRAWDLEWQDPDGPAVRRLEVEHSTRIAHHKYLQWQAEQQLACVRRTAERLGMSIGLYHDLAVGIDGGGAEAWDRQAVLASEASVGAPPDAWNPKGQGWGLPPFHPQHLAERAYAPFVELLRANMRRGGALRVDHILGLMRLYWIPRGAPPTDGAYVDYPWRDLLAILALESRRNRCLVIGEDLGTVPEGLREAMAEAGILSYRLLYFEKAEAGSFRRPDDYPKEALVAVSTHDLPTLAAYWAESDLALRDRLDLWPSPELRAAAYRERTGDRAALLELLRTDRPADGAMVMESPPVLPVHEFLARTPCRLLMVQIEDVIGQIEQVNVPGTSDQHPNWRRRLAVPLDAVLDGAPLREMALRLNRWRSDRPAEAAPAEPDRAGRRSPPAVPVATYRLQLTEDFTFDDASRIVPYLSALGVSHLYLSPWFKARPGSRHGYDITEHNTVNPELGGSAGLAHLVAVLADYGLGQIVDFVPNHMGIGEAGNTWWLDVLEWGPASPYAAFFDIEWEPADRRLRHKVLLPFLGDQYGRELEAGRLVPRFEASSGTFAIWYFTHRFPIAVRHYPELVRQAIDAPALGPELSAALSAIADGFAKLVDEERRIPDAGRTVARALQAQLAGLALEQASVAQALGREAAALGGTPGDAKSFRRLHRLLEQQHYRLAYWRVASDEINYRRFFNINDLAGIRIENDELFAASHRLIAQFVAEGKLHGLRIDHIDGLYDPRGYCLRLQQLVAGAAGTDAPFYLVVEKILARHERLRTDWPVSGTTGYDFAAQIGGFLVDPTNEAAATANYHRFIRREPEFDELLQAAKELVMDTMLSSELAVLANELHRIAQRNWNSRDYTRNGLRRALRAVVACFPVYRTYVTPDAVSAEDRRDIEWAVARARQEWQGLGSGILDFVAHVLTGDATSAGAGAAFAMKFQQFTAPVMAKGMEDTTFYRYHRLVALNEVGGDPRQFGLSVAAFHHANQERARYWPHAMLATATHDTKRGEDLRARLAALSETVGEWTQESANWARLNLGHKQEFDGRPAPGRNDEYLLYQTLVGAWPPDLDDDPAALRDFEERLQAYMRKAVRESKERSSWDNPNAEYEAALEQFIARLFDVKRGRPFRRRFLHFQARLARLGMLNSLVQVTLKLTSPGVPDIFQGTELWDFHLVDPDNRQPVAFERRAQLLADVSRVAALNGEGRVAAVERLRENSDDGKIKLYLLRQLLALRREQPELFAAGDYRPLAVAGAWQDSVCAFQRSHGGRTLVVVAGRHFAALTPSDSTFPVVSAWQDTLVQRPHDDGFPLRDVLTDRAHTGSTLQLSDLFATLPVAVLVGSAAPQH